MHPVIHISPLKQYHDDVFNSLHGGPLFNSLHGGPLPTVFDSNRGTSAAANYAPADLPGHAHSRLAPSAA
jgi:hypothetical protein